MAETIIQFSALAVDEILNEFFYYRGHCYSLTSSDFKLIAAIRHDLQLLFQNGVSAEKLRAEIADLFSKYRLFDPKELDFFVHAFLDVLVQEMPLSLLRLLAIEFLAGGEKTS